ncbi:MAG: hypothetical protein ACRDBP_11035 [Luteolibacter sp.]
MIQFLAIAALLVVGWLNVEERFSKLESRLLKLEADSKTLAPISNLMRGYQPNRAEPDAYAAKQATGPANVPAPGADSALAWCPAAEDEGMEWLELHYEHPVLVQEIRIHTTFNPGAVIRVLGGSKEGDLQEMWAGTGPREPIQVIPISPPVEMNRIKLEIDTAKVPGWNEIDAVALVDDAGRSTWAHTAVSSSVWSKPPLPQAR